MVKYISYYEQSQLKRLGIVGAFLLSIAGIIDTIFMFVSSNYMILSIGSTLLLTLGGGRVIPESVVIGMVTLIMMAFFLSLILDKVVYRKFPNNKGLMTIIAGVIMAFTFYYFAWPAIIGWLA